MSLTAKSSLVVKRETCHECLQNANNVVGIAAMPDMTGIFIHPIRSSSRLSCLSHSSRSSQLSRLRSTTYLDGTSSTNHYSCCRLLWSRDREGRTVLRSAVTGEDQLYYAEEDVYLREISSGTHHRVTRHYLDAIGRETNTTVSVEAMPGAATNRLGAVGQNTTVTTMAYPRGTDDLVVLVDARGRTTTNETIHSTNLVTTLEIVSTNGVDVLTNTTIRVRGGATTRRADGDGSWTSTRTETDYLPNGCRCERKFRDSSDLHGTSAEDHVAETSVYDFLGRQVSTTRPGANGGSVVTTNVYDHRSRRIRKIVRHYTGSVWTTFKTHTFVWDNWNIVLEEIVSANNTTNRIEYFWGNDLSGTEQGAGGVGGLLAVRQNGAFHIPVYDGSGNIVMYVSETGTVSARYVYDPYGQIVQMSGDCASQFPFGFSTKYHDREVGLIPYQLRVYDPSNGCWLSRDPIEESGGVNLHCFSGNSPQTTIDVLGLLSSETNPFFKGPKARFSISKYVEYEATEIQYVNQWYDFLSFIPLQRKELDEYIYTLNFIPRFTSPVHEVELPYADYGRNALGGFNQMYRTIPGRGDVPRSKWGNGSVEFIEKSIAGIILRKTTYFPDSEIAYGYFVYKADNDHSPFRLIDSNDTMYQRWSIGLERLSRKDKYYTGKRFPCEIIEIQFGDKGYDDFKRIRFHGCLNEEK